MVEGVHTAVREGQGEKDKAGCGGENQERKMLVMLARIPRRHLGSVQELEERARLERAAEQNIELSVGADP